MAKIIIRDEDGTDRTIEPERINVPYGMVIAMIIAILFPFILSALINYG